MHPFQQEGELSWQNINIDNKEEDQGNHNNGDTSSARVESLIPRKHVYNNRTRRSKQNQRSCCQLLTPHDDTIINTSTNSIDVVDESKKKIMHRDIERQRRQEMSQLCASLHSILPSHYTKGKRSTSDHLEEAVNYIKELEKNVKELTNTRDKLKDSPSVQQECGRVDIITRQGGLLDIEITTLASEIGGFCLSNALQLVIEEGLSVVSCASTNVNHDRVLHQIVCEATSTECIEIGRLQQRLIDLVE